MPGEYLPRPSFQTILPSVTRAAYVFVSSVEKKTRLPTIDGAAEDAARHVAAPELPARRGAVRA